MPDHDIAGHVEQLLRDHPPATTASTAFFGARFDAGLAWVHAPQGAGGLAADPAQQRIVVERLDAAGAPSNFPLNPIGLGMVAPTIVHHGTDEQRQRYLRPLFTTEEVWCQLFSEPGAGSDLAGLATRAERDGDEWVVNGQKVWTSLGHKARFGLLLARTDPDAPKNRGLTTFLVDMQAPGVEVRPLRQMTGDSEFNEVYLTDVRLPAAAQLGPVGKGWQVATTTLMNERVSIGNAMATMATPADRAVNLYRERGHDDPVLRDRSCACGSSRSSAGSCRSGPASSARPAIRARSGRWGSSSAPSTRSGCTSCSSRSSARTGCCTPSSTRAAHPANGPTLCTSSGHVRTPSKAGRPR